MASEQYWKERAERRIELGEKFIDEILTDTKTLYTRSIRSIEKEIEAFYTRYSLETGASITEIRKRLDPTQLTSARQDIQRYYDEVRRVGGYSPEYKEYLRSLSARAYMSRLEELKLQFRHEIENLTVKQQNQFKETLSGQYADQYYRSVFDIQQSFQIGWPFQGLSPQMIDRAIKEKWVADGNYSTRIWVNMDRLRRNLENTFLHGVARGFNPKKIAREIASDMVTGYNNAVRLARTEFNYLANQATKESYKQLGIDEYQYLATLDHRTSEECQALDGKRFLLSEAIPGVNLPAVHPNCRSTTIPVPDPDYQYLERMATDPETGKPYRVPPDMTFQQWRKNLTENQQKLLVPERGHGEYNRKDFNAMLLRKYNEGQTELFNSRREAETGLRAATEGCLAHDMIRYTWGAKEYGRDENARIKFDEETGLSKWIDNNRDIHWNGGTLYRGIQLNDEDYNILIKDIELGNLTNQKGPSSWSPSEKTAEKFTKYSIGEEDRNNRIMFIEDFTPIKQGFFNNANTQQREVIYSGNVVFRPLSFELGDEITYIRVREEK